MKDILLFTLIVFMAYGLGRRALSLFAKETESLLEDIVFSSAIGFALLGYLVYGIGSLGFLYKGPVLILFVVCAFAAAGPFCRLVRRLTFPRSFNWLSGEGTFDRFLLGILIFIPVLSLFGAMAPEIGNDALAYHLDHSKIFAGRHSIGFIPFTRESLWPYFGQMFFTAGLLLESVTAAKLSHYFFGILLILSVFSFTRRFFSKKKALLAAALLASSPGIFTQMTYAYVDLTQGFYSFMALYAIMLWVKREQLGLLALSGLFAGIALSVKLMSGMALIALVFVVLLSDLHKKTQAKKVFAQLFVLGLFAFAAGFVWYLRSYLVLGNPVYPFLHNIFGSGWETHLKDYVGTRTDLLGFFLLPWDMVIHVDSFGGEQIGVIFLAFFPLLIFLPRHEKNIQYLFCFFIIHAIIWYIVNPMLRYTFVNFAVAFILISLGFYGASEKYGLVFLKKLLAGCVIFNFLLCVYHNYDTVALALGVTTRDEYLARNERTFPVADFVNKNTPSDSVIVLVGESRGFYFNRQVLQYGMWEHQTDKNILSYLRELTSRSVPTYILYRDDYDIHPFGPIIDERDPLMVLERKVERGKRATYYLFRI
ncbi:MAG: glycosyltransferase family 39 protein [Candidatus Omnitrophica bacterium]|nr:glycosyltransferase family 39 protein [Candidatus Omnitrophota bacterium]MDD4012792.1 glycosyltransferase family 39 protein [Candidatus Omnitrophota bacterium]